MIGKLLRFRNFSLLYLCSALLIALLTAVVGFSVSSEETVYEGDGNTMESVEYSPGIYAIEVDYVSDCYGMIQVIPEGERDLWSVDHSIAFMPDYTNHAASLFRVDQDGVSISVSILPVQEDAAFFVENVVIVRRRMMSATYNALKIMFAALIIYGIAAFVYAVLDKETERNKKLLFMGIILLWFVSMFGFMQGYLPGGQDADFHLTRIAGIADGIRSGHFPVRMYMDFANDYGYPLGIMYGDLFLYPSAILHMMGLPLWQCYVFYVGYISLLTAIISCYAFSRMTGNMNIGFAGSVLYTLSAWRLNDVYLRAAAGEYAAMAFLPLIALGFFEVFSRHDTDDSESDRRAFLVLVTGYFGVIQTHMLSSIIITVFLVVIGLILIRRVLSPARILLILKSAAVAFAANLAFIIPMVDYYLSHDLAVEDQTINIQTQGAYWSQLFSTTGNMLLGSKAITDSIGIYEDMPLGMGIGLLFVLFGCLMVLLVDRECRYKLIFGICSATAVVSLWMSTCYFPYDFIARRLTFVGRIIGRVQFPWRYLVVTTLSLTIAGVFLLKYLWEKNIQYYVLGCSLLLVITVTMAFGFVSDRVSQNDICITAMNSDHIASPMIDKDTMYWIQGMTRDVLVDRDIYTSGEGVTAVMTGCAMPSCEIAFSGAGGGDSYIEPPILDYKGYHAYCDGVELTVSDGDNYRIRVELPDKNEGVVNIEYREPVLWRIAEFVSVIAWVLLAVYGFMGGRKKKISE
ncbi:MAG: hypothetical protein IJS12_00565 [Lachnospiraceae bacterium]|nr:hypothetical protein [Lachnospiraceae bacterium]